MLNNEAKRLNQFATSGEESYKRFQTGGYANSSQSQRSKPDNPTMPDPSILETLKSEIEEAMLVLQSPALGLNKSDSRRFAEWAARTGARDVVGIVKEACNLYHKCGRK